MKDCVVDLYESGMRARDAGMIYKLNEKAVFKVITPAGETNPITVEEIVKQGTVFGPKLCCASTGKINNGLAEQEVLYPSVAIQAVTFLDDINGGGSKRFVQAVMMNCSRKEDEKLWEFSTDKSKWMCIANRKRKIDEIEVDVKQGRIGRTSVYKFLGNFVNEKGNMDDQIDFMKTKSKTLIREANKMCCPHLVGRYELDAKLLVYESAVIKSLYYNIETWTNLRKSDAEQMEILQGQVLKGMLGLPMATPYWGILCELDILPINLVLTYRKLMLYHSIMNSDDRRVIKYLLREQEKSQYKACWFGNMKEEGERLGVTVNEEVVVGKLKSQWKKEVKQKIRTAYNQKLKEKKKESKKMRFLHKKGIDTYLKTLANENAKMAITIRLNVTSWIEGNLGKERCCPLCANGEDTTEHVFNCEATENKMMVTVKDLENGERMESIVELFKTSEELRRKWMLDEIQTNLLMNNSE